MITMLMQSIKCQQCNTPFNVYIKMSKPVPPPDYDAEYEVVCPNCRKKTRFYPHPGPIVKEKDCNNSIPIAKKV